MKIDEYIVINLSKLKERIEELESKIVPNPNFDNEIDNYNLLFIAKQNELKQILSKSTQLTPLLQNAFDESRRQHSWAGGNLYGDGYNEEQDLTDFKYSTSQDYINNLKLDI